MLRLPRFLPLLAGLVLSLLAASGHPTRSAGEDIALVADLQGAIGPASTKFVEDVLDQARERSARIVVFRLDTPGGLSESMRDIIRVILASSVPVAVYVAPSGARAASAGTYIIYASHVAAMAPGTNLGAATPIPMGGTFPTPEPKKPPEGGEDKDEKGPAEDTMPGGDAMQRKIVNDAVAYIRSLAELRGRNAEWAEQAVREGASLPASEAAEREVVDFLATGVGQVLEQAHGRTVTVGEREVTLATAGLTIERVEPDWQIELLSILTNPNVAFILMMIGIYGLIFEFLNPGSIGPGVLGAISLAVGLYALNLLPLDYAGLGLLLLGVAFMVAEALTPTFGVLGLGGVVAFVLGAIFLLDSESPEFRLHWGVIAGTSGATAALFMLLLGYVWRAHRRPATTGAAEVVGHPATVIEWAGDQGYVQARGERWRARGKGPFAPGDAVTVQRMDGLTLHVAPVPRDEQGEDE